MVTELQHDIQLLNRPWRSAGFAVLKAPDIPSVLVELGYVSNPQEERMLKSKSYRVKMSTAIIRAIDVYFDAAQNAGL
jgi:N-acetylmuramoyl-L-alanine amidase